MRKWGMMSAAAAIVAGFLLPISCATFTSIPFDPVFEGRELEKPVDLNKLNYIQ